jgi:hypothetical protein
MTSFTCHCVSRAVKTWAGENIMNTLSTSTAASSSDRRSRLVSGAILITMGALALLDMALEGSGKLILPVLAALFTVWGIAIRQGGLLIPAAPLGGIGLFTLLESTPFLNSMSDDREAALFFGCFTLGWLYLVVMARLFTPQRMDWALIPAGIMGALATVLSFGLDVAEYLQFLGPIVLMVIGVLVLTNARLRR